MMADEIEELKEIVEAVRKDNPYPEDIFGRPTAQEYTKMRETLREAGLSSDKFFGSNGRMVWNNCCDAILKELKDRIAEEGGVIYKCKFCGLEVDEIPDWKEDECSGEDTGHYFGCYRKQEP